MLTGKVEHLSTQSFKGRTEIVILLIEDSEDELSIAAERYLRAYPTSDFGTLLLGNGIMQHPPQDVGKKFALFTRLL